jgi:hypothetical protein
MSLETYPSWNEYLAVKVTPEDTDMGDVEASLLDIAGGRVAGDYLTTHERARFLSDSYTIDMADDEPRMEELDQSQCHFNVARFWMYHHDEEQENWTENPYTIMTGYGLGPDDDIWRTHSWLVDIDGEVIETTVPRRMYVGVYLRETAEALSFCHGEDVYSRL